MPKVPRSAWATLVALGVSLSLLVPMASGPESGGVADRTPLLDGSWSPPAAGFDVYAVTFNETGLPPATPWSVILNSTPEQSTTTTVVFAEPNGSFPFLVEPVPGFGALPSAGTVTVNDSAVNVSVAFNALYPVTFTESGLPSGTGWSVALNGSSNSSSSPAIGFSEPNGSYPFSVSGVAGYRAVPANGSINVTGTGATEGISFQPLAPEQFSVSFGETGLMSGTTWSVTVNGTAQTGSGSTISFSLPNGSYPFEIPNVPGYVPAPADGTLAVNGANLSEAIEFARVPSPQYVLAFKESGLPSGTPWSVELNGTGNSSTDLVNSFLVPNGTYGFVVATVSGYAAFPANGTAVVSGSNQTIPIAFRPIAVPPSTYLLSFRQLVLPPDAVWWVVLNGTNASSNSTSIGFSVPNGTYAYTIGPCGSWYPPRPLGNATVAGSAISVAVTFVYTYGITFDRPNGTAPGNSWSVTLAGRSALAIAGPAAGSVTRNSTGMSITFAEPNGTYQYYIEVTGAPNYGVAGLAYVAGNAPTIVPLPLSSSPGAGTSTSGPTIDLNEAIGIVVGVVLAIEIIGIVLVVRRGRTPPETPGEDGAGTPPP